MKDVTKCLNTVSEYGGSELKRTFYFANNKYMVKFPDPIRQKNKNISYINNQFSEHLGCLIFNFFNIDVQETELVTGVFDGKKKIGVACKDFLHSDEKLIEFKNLSYSIRSDKTYTNDISDIFEMLSLLPNFKEKEIFKNHFYKVLIVDTLIGNNDRHLGNWGIIVKDNKYRLSPIYDCGSAFHPLLSEKEMHDILLDDVEMKNVSINLKTAYKINEKPFTYIEIYKKMPLELKKALNEIYDKIDLEKLKKIIYDVEELSEIQKEFYYTSLELRKKYIIDKYYIGTK